MFKKIWILGLLIYSMLPASAVDVSVCGTLSTDAEQYNLISNLSAVGTCLVLGANNITINGNGYWIHYTNTSVGYGIQNNGWDNVVIRDVNINAVTTTTAAHGIYAYNGANYVTVYNTTVKTTGTDQKGIYHFNSNYGNFTGNYINTTGASNAVYFQGAKYNTLINNTFRSGSSNGIRLFSESSYNTLSGNTIISVGNNAISVYQSGNNTISGGAIYQGSSLYDYYIRENIYNNNTFNQTGWLNPKKIYIYDNYSTFIYSNASNIWINSKVVISPSTDTGITRNILSWDISNLSWTDTLTASRKMNYIVSGLSPLTNYKVYNGSTEDFNLTSNISGYIPSFEVNISTVAIPIYVLKVYAFTSWGNTYTNNDSLLFSAPEATNITFNVTSNDPTTWLWYIDSIDQSNNFDNISTSLGVGTHNITVIGMGVTGNSSLQWNVTISPTTIVYYISGYINNSWGLLIDSARIGINGSYVFSNNGYYSTQSQNSTPTITIESIGYLPQTDVLSLSGNITNNNYSLLERQGGTMVSSAIDFYAALILIIYARKYAKRF